MSTEYLDDLLPDPKQRQKHRIKYCIAYPLRSVLPGKWDTFNPLNKIILREADQNPISEAEMHTLGNQINKGQTQSFELGVNNSFGKGESEPVSTQEDFMQFLHSVRRFRKAIGRLYGGRLYSKWVAFVGLWGVEMEKGHLTHGDIKRFRNWKTEEFTNKWVQIYVKLGWLVEMQRPRAMGGKQRSYFFLSASLKASILRAWGQCLGEPTHPVRMPSYLVASFRLRAGYTQRQFAEVLGVPHSTLRDIETGAEVSKRMNEILIDNLYWALPKSWWSLKIKQEVEAGIRPYPWRPNPPTPKQGRQHFRVKSDYHTEREKRLKNKLP